MLRNLPLIGFLLEIKVELTSLPRPKDRKGNLNSHFFDLQEMGQLSVKEQLEILQRTVMHQADYLRTLDLNIKATAEQYQLLSNDILPRFNVMHQLVKKFQDQMEKKQQKQSPPAMGNVEVVLTASPSTQDPANASPAPSAPGTSASEKNL